MILCPNMRKCAFCKLSSHCLSIIFPCRRVCNSVYNTLISDTLRKSLGILWGLQPPEQFVFKEKNCVSPLLTKWMKNQALDHIWYILENKTKGQTHNKSQICCGERVGAINNQLQSQVSLESVKSPMKKGESN